ncbi:MAG: AmmeMemoRadiSam system protein B [Candidatus Omnitrophota bacterium]
MTILKPNAAGRFYPANSKILADDVKDYLNEAAIEPSEEPVLAVLSPHAGYVFSGPIAGYSFRHIQNQSPDTVLAIALAHHGAEGGCVFDGKAFETPLGSVFIDGDLVSALLAEGPPIQADIRPYLGEHSIEVNLPFIQTVFPQAKIATILITRLEPSLCRSIGHKIAGVLRQSSKKILIVVSSDMTHYPPYDDANRIDQAMLKSMESLKPDVIYKELDRLSSERVKDLHCVMCGSAAMMTAIEAAVELGATKAKTLHYRNSGDSPHGERDRVVGYGAFAIYGASSGKPAIEVSP